MDSVGDVYVAEQGSHVIRKVPLLPITFNQMYKLNLCLPPGHSVFQHFVTRFAGTRASAATIAVECAPTSAVLVAPGALFIDSNGV